MSQLPNGVKVGPRRTWDQWDAIPQYEYTPLRESYIRLLILFPAQSSSEDIFCELIDSELVARGVQPPTYEALSWAWGSDLWTSSIQIRTHGQYFRQQVPQSLSSALRVLRYRAAQRIIWVDAVCINQKSTEERNIQVPLMTAIYSHSFNVCIWLGNSDQYTALAIDFIKNEILQLHNFDELCESSEAIPKWTAMLQLMQRPWFSRRWVVQEIALSRDAVMYCGEYQIRWHDFASAVQLVVDAESTSQAVSNSMRHVRQYHHIQNQFEYVNALGASLLVDATRNMFRQSTDNRLQPVFSIEYLMARMQAFEVTEPKDAIYALLALAKDTVPVHSTSSDLLGKQFSGSKERVPGERAIIKWAEQHSSRKRYLVDYSQTYVEVCIQFMSFCIRYSEPTQALNILCRPWAPLPREHKTPTDESLALPSWIPSLSNASFSMFQYPNSVSRMSRSSADYLVGLPDEKLRYSAAGTTSIFNHSLEFRTTPSCIAMMVVGFILDEVGDIEVPSQNGYISEDWIKRGNWNDLAQEPPDEFWRTLIADRSIDGGNAPAYGARAVHLSVIRTRSGGHLNTTELVNSPSFIISQFFRRVQAVIWNKSLMQSRQGRLGLVRSNVKPGDIICIFSGCSVPVILRRHMKSAKRRAREKKEQEEIISERKLNVTIYLQRLWRARLERRKKNIAWEPHPNTATLGLPAGLDGHESPRQPRYNSKPLFCLLCSNQCAVTTSRQYAHYHSAGPLSPGATDPGGRMETPTQARES